MHAPPVTTLRRVFADTLRRRGFEPPAALVDAAVWRHLPRGEVLFRQGDLGDGLYVVLQGRVEVVADGGRVIARLGRGEIVGELALLTGETRSATVRATRDTYLARLDREHLDAATLSEPRFIAFLLASVADRLHATVAQREDLGHGTLALVPVGANGTDACAALMALVPTMRDVGVSRWREAATADVAGDPTAFAGWLDEREEPVDLLFVDFTGATADDLAVGLGAVDRIAIVADARDPAALAPLVPLLTELTRRQFGPPVTLVLVHPDDTAQPTGTGRWLDRFGFASRYHWRSGDAAGLRRLARVLAGRAVGVVLSGGGARGFAHIGALRAMTEAGIAIDLIGGTSFGGVTAALFATGHSFTAIQEINRGWTKRRIDRGYTLPLASFLAGTRGARILRDFFGEARFEDLWRDCFCTLVDASHGRLLVCDRGPMAYWLNAAISVPALFPPTVTPEGALIYDGGLLDNFPVASIAARGPRRITGVNVSPHADMTVRPGRASPRDGFSELARRLFGRAAPFPNIVRLLYRASGYEGREETAARAAMCDLYIEPSVAGFAANDFADIDIIVERGYRSTCERLAAIDTAPYRDAL